MCCIIGMAYIGSHSRLKITVLGDAGGGHKLATQKLCKNYAEQGVNKLLCDWRPDHETWSDNGHHN